MEQELFLDRYRLSLGRNGLPVQLHRSPLAYTYRAQDSVSGREVALSLVVPRPTEPAVLSQLTERAAAAKRIDHINLPRLYDFGYDEKALIYVSEVCRGRTAVSWVAARGPLALSAALQVGLQVADVLHATGLDRLYHAALNPYNILFDASHAQTGDWLAIKVLHWFLPAANLSGSDTEADSSVLFASPEQLRDGRLEMSSQIYSLGATLLYLLTGLPPIRVLGKRPTNALLRRTPKRVRRLLGAMTRANPDKRPHDPVALAAFLQACLGRAERRQMIERRLALPVVVAGRATRRIFPAELTSKPLAIAALLVGFVSAAAFVFLGPWREHGVPSNRPQVADLQPNLPDHTRAPSSETRTKPVTAPALIATQGAAKDRSARAPTKQLNVERTREFAPPAQEPVASSEVAMANDETPTDNAASSARSDQSSPSSGENDATDAATSETELGSATVADTRQTDTNKKAKSATQPSHRRTTQRNRATIASNSKSSRLQRKAKRARPIPRLHVGSEQAELVGTTADGHWILSVANTGERVIVPPPPDSNP